MQTRVRLVQTDVGRYGFFLARRGNVSSKIKKNNLFIFITKVQKFYQESIYQQEANPQNINSLL